MKGSVLYEQVGIWYTMLCIEIYCSIYTYTKFLPKNSNSGPHVAIFGTDAKNLTSEFRMFLLSFNTASFVIRDFLPREGTISPPNWVVSNNSHTLALSNSKSAYFFSIYGVKEFIRCLCFPYYTHSDGCHKGKWIIKEEERIRRISKGGIIKRKSCTATLD